MEYAVSIQLTFLFFVFLSFCLAYKRLLIQNNDLLDELELGRKKFDELNHKIKNNLQLVISILSLQAKENHSPEIEAFYKKSKKRINTLVLFHEKLSEYNGGMISFEEYLVDLKDFLFETFGIDKRRILFDVNVESFHLDFELALSLGLIINELICNSVIHAFEKKDGIIRVVINKSNDGYSNVLFYSDNGIGYDITKESGLGLKMVKLLIKQISGDFQVKSDRFGTEYNVKF